MESKKDQRKCPKCGGDMEIGFLRDRSRGRLSQRAEWMQGVPETTWFGSLKLGANARYAVEAFRCERCGFLEHYAMGPEETGLL